MRKRIRKENLNNKIEKKNSFSFGKETKETKDDTRTRTTFKAYINRKPRVYP